MEKIKRQGLDMKDQVASVKGKSEGLGAMDVEEVKLEWKDLVSKDQVQW